MTAVAERASQAPARPQRRMPVLVIALFTGASLLGATLLFAVQPMVAKMLLPSYGGSPMVWNTAMLFFQSALLAGYAYAHWSQRRLGPKTQPLAQIALVALPLLVLPIALPAWAAAPESAPPALWLLMVLAVMVGAPFAVLATTSPLVQRWYSWSGLPRAHDPYFLFAASNTGSFVALLAYPVLIEPRADVTTQARWWALAYGLFAALMVGCALVVRFAGVSGRVEPVARTADAAEAAVAGETAAKADSETEGAGSDAGGEPGAGEDTSAAGAAATGPDATGEDAAAPAVPAEQRGPQARDETIGWRRRLRWLGLAFVPSSLMLGVTTHISTDIAAVPLLWVVPLSLYLVTFIVAFAGTAQRWLTPTVYLAGGLALVLPWIAGLSKALPATVVLPPVLLLLVVAGLAGHGLLAADRPSPRRLTEFYLVVSVGGALGGLFNGLLAPVVFDWVAEFPLVAALLGMFPMVLGRGAAIAARLGKARQWVSGGVMLVGLPLIAVTAYFSEQLTWAPFVLVIILWAWGMAVLARPVFLAVSAGAMVLVLFSYQVINAGARERTFFGSYEVRTTGDRHTLSHGTTLHGFQLNDQPRTPTSYYAKSGPLGDVFAAYSGTPSPVGVVGLGAGTIAAYGQPGRRFDFYEIDPEVVRIARNPRHFTYLRDCGCQLRTIVGDGRLRLAAAPDSTYGVIVLDAFSSDAVPAHLLTKEALTLYMRKLRPGGVLAFHVSNRHLDLAPMLGATARAGGFATRSVLFDPGEDEIAHPSQWVAIGRTQADLEPLRVRNARWEAVRAGGPVWTDTYSSLFKILKLG